jgi:membrane-associated phospholipid phosphatase
MLLTLVLATAPAAAPGQASAQELKPSDPAFWALSGATLLTAWHLDGSLRRDEGRPRAPTPDVLAKVGYRMGSSDVLVPAFSSALVLTQVTGWPTDSRRVAHVLVGAASAGLVTEAVKSGMGRARPRTASDPRRFQPLTRDNSWMAFPSGHSAAGFGVAAALAQEFDLGALEPAVYGVAAVIAWSRVYDDAHWVSDTVAGAVIGIAVARTTVAWLNRVRTTEAEPTAPRAEGPGVPVVLLRVRW